MSVIKWNSNDLFPKLDSFFDDFFKRDSFFKAVDLGTVMPAANLKETSEAYHLDIAVPGLRKEDFKITLDNKILTISSEKKEEKEEKDGEKITKREFNYSSFQRIFQLPDNIKDEVVAKYENGLLKVIIPKTQKAENSKSKQIEVE
jgi:HSP20 family protein